jgi:hypothetical protein
MDEIIELTKDELIETNGGWDNLWDLLGDIFTFHAREVMYSDCAPSVLAYK